ncbi:hypothetical protein [Streptomyces sp. NPDC006691]|uniref:hypothetical protein n=1 Tax=Streptomyces sp. NPDC006691 TaxID=3364757 RepID=UPI0036C8C136
MQLTFIISVQRSGSEMIPLPGLEPILTPLATRRERDGRPVPGRVDEERTALARRYARPR